MVVGAFFRQDQRPYGNRLGLVERIGEQTVPTLVGDVRDVCIAACAHARAAARAVGAVTRGSGSVDAWAKPISMATTGMNRARI
jgi:hypothetical protein